MLRPCPSLAIFCVPEVPWCTGWDGVPALAAVLPACFYPGLPLGTLCLVGTPVPTLSPGAPVGHSRPQWGQRPQLAHWPLRVDGDAGPAGGSGGGNCASGSGVGTLRISCPCRGVMRLRMLGSSVVQRGHVPDMEKPGESFPERLPGCRDSCASSTVDSTICLRHGPLRHAHADLLRVRCSAVSSTSPTRCCGSLVPV